MTTVKSDNEELNNSYEIINSFNFYTFIDNIFDYRIKIDNFYIDNKEYQRLIYYNLDEWLLFLIESFKKDTDKKKVYGDNLKKMQIDAIYI